MTTTQVAYWDLQERKRANLANEGETKRSNLAREAETSRSNRATEGWRDRQLAETGRSNLANEAIKSDQLAETKRSNIANEAIKRDQLFETRVSNRAKETENERHNKAVEAETAKKNFYDIQNVSRGLDEQHRVNSSTMFRNYSSGAKDISSTIGNLTDLIKGFGKKRSTVGFSGN